MNEQLIDFKFSEYAGRLGVAFYHKKDFQKAKRLELNALLLLHMKTRAIIARKLDIEDELRSAERSIKKMSQSGIKFPLAQQRVEKLKRELKAARKELAEVGQAAADALDTWQILGATPYELANLCNRSYAQVLREIGPEILDKRFSELIHICSLDYKSKLSRIDSSVDAPLTHALLAHFRWQLMNRATAQKAADVAVREYFPGIMEMMEDLSNDRN